MALRDQPYLPLYVQDFLTDEKLLRCSAASTGVYIRLLCHMHKAEKYGCFTIKEKDRIFDSILDDFARVFTRFSPYDFETVQSAFQELFEEEVIYIYRNSLCQKRMVRDGELSETRAASGRKGASKTNAERAAKSEASREVAEGFAEEFAEVFAAAKSPANAENENEIENENESKNESSTLKHESEMLITRDRAAEETGTSTYIGTLVEVKGTGETPEEAVDVDPKPEKPAQRKQKDAPTPKTKYAEFVSLTNDEYSSLVAKLGEEGARRCIELLDNYKGANGKRYASDYRAILNWVIKRYEEELEKELLKARGSQVIGAGGRASPQPAQASNPFFEMWKKEVGIVDSPRDAKASDDDSGNIPFVCD